MASSKDIYEAGMFSAGMYAAGIFRGVGVQAAPPFDISSDVYILGDETVQDVFLLDAPAAVVVMGRDLDEDVVI